MFLFRPFFFLFPSYAAGPPTELVATGNYSGGCEKLPYAKNCLIGKVWG
jgi:hypothetical protein